jgi:hypothetical protein
VKKAMNIDNNNQSINLMFTLPLNPGHHGRLIPPG